MKDKKPLDAVAEPPPNFMTPRSPTRDNEDRYKSNRSLKVDTPNQRDPNSTLISHHQPVARKTSGSSLGSMGDGRDPRGDQSFVSPPGGGVGIDVKTSTPKYDSSRGPHHIGSAQSESPYMSLSMIRDRTHKIEDDAPRSSLRPPSPSRQHSTPIKTPQPLRPPSPVPGTTQNTHDINTHNSTIYASVGRPASAHNVARRLPQEPPEPQRPVSAKDYNSLPRFSANKPHNILPNRYSPLPGHLVVSTSITPHNQNYANGLVPPQNNPHHDTNPHNRPVTPQNHPLHNYGPQGPPARRQLSSDSSASLNRNGSTSSTGSQNEVSPKHVYNNNHKDQNDSFVSPNNSNVSQHDNLIHRLNLDDSRSSSTSHRDNSYVDPDNQYMPGNVRNLVQNFHKSMQQGPSPVPPPRRPRPLSAGPYRSPDGTSNGLGTTNGFGIEPGPLRASMGQFNRSPGSPPDKCEVPRPSTATGRLLPTRPDDNSTAGSTPPRPGGKDGPKKSNIWYEYGCI